MHASLDTDPAQLPSHPSEAPISTLPPLHQRLGRWVTGAIQDAFRPFAPELTVWEQESIADEIAEREHLAQRERRAIKHEAARVEHYAQLEREGLTEAIQNMKERGYAYKMPDFAEQCADTSRTTRFLTSTGKILTEHEGLAELAVLIDRIPGQAGKSLRDNMNFLGAPEFKKGVHLLAMYIKTLLLDDSELQVCLLPFASSGLSEIKSDKVVLNALMGEFSDKELALFQGQIVFNAEDITAPLKRLRLFWPDDTRITGMEVHRAYDAMRRYRPDLAKKLELLRLAATPNSATYASGGPSGQLPLVSCYQTAGTQTKHLLTSLHRTSLQVYDEQARLGKFPPLIRQYHLGDITPGLLRVKRTYGSVVDPVHINRAASILHVRPPQDIDPNPFELSEQEEKHRGHV